MLNKLKKKLIQEQIHELYMNAQVTGETDILYESVTNKSQLFFEHLMIAGLERRAK